jgi:RNA polymerase primary sigma factor
MDAAEAACEQTLLRKAKAGDPEGREQVIRRYDRLLRGTASRYRGLGLPLEDIAQEGAIGLLEAIDSFDEARGASFETFARWHVRHAITDALTAQSRLVRLPKQVVERRRAVARTASELTARTSHTPTAVEIGAETGLSLESIEAVQTLPTAPASLDESLGEGGTMLEVIEDPAAIDPEAEALALHRDEVIAEALEELPQRERQVIDGRFGFGRPELTLVDLSRELGLCPQRTRAIEQHALYRLAKMLERDPTFQHPPWSEWTFETANPARRVSPRRDSGTRRRRASASPSRPSGATRYVSPPRPRRARGSRASGRG